MARHSTHPAALLSCGRETGWMAGSPFPAPADPRRDPGLPVRAAPGEAGRELHRPVDPDCHRPFGGNAPPGLVVRTGYGRYERADLVADGALPAVIVRDATLACLNGPVHCDTVATLTGRTPLHALQVLQQLVRHGLAVHLGQGMFSPRHGDTRADSEACGTVRAVAGDAVLGNRKEVPCSHSPSPAAIPATP